MNILITNDDGYKSDALHILAEKLSKENNVYILAPDSNRSAVSHHITMYSENLLEKINGNEWTCSGYPADCAFIGFNSKMWGENVKIDAVVAGINYGPNLGTDIIYSGTCSAARESVLRGIPAIAVSLDPEDWDKAAKEGFKFGPLADFVEKNLKTLLGLAKLDYPRAFVNVNAPNLEKYKGVKMTDILCIRDYEDHINIISDYGSGDKFKTKFTPGNKPVTLVPGSDLSLVRNGYISVSVVYADPVSRPVVDGISFSL